MFNNFFTKVIICIAASVISATMTTYSGSENAEAKVHATERAFSQTNEFSKNEREPDGKKEVLNTSYRGIPADMVVPSVQSGKESHAATKTSYMNTCTPIAQESENVIEDPSDTTNLIITSEMADQNADDKISENTSDATEEDMLSVDDSECDYYDEEYWDSVCVTPDDTGEESEDADEELEDAEEESSDMDDGSKATEEEPEDADEGYGMKYEEIISDASETSNNTYSTETDEKKSDDIETVFSENGMGNTPEDIPSEYNEKIEDIVPAVPDSEYIEPASQKEAIDSSTEHTEE